MDSDDQVPIELRRLYNEAVRFTQQVAAPQVLASAHNGVDATRTVMVIMGADGRVADVSVEPGWSHRLTVDELGNAVVEAAHDAATRRLAAWAETTGAPSADAAGGHADHRTAGPEPPHVPKIPPSGQLGDLASPTVEANVSELFELMADARAAIATVGQRLEALAAARTSGSSPRGEVAVTLQGDQPVDVEFSPDWIRRASVAEIAPALRKAFADAYQRHGSLSLDDLATGTPLAALRCLIADPETLLRRIGLRADSDLDEGRHRATAD